MVFAAIGVTDREAAFLRGRFAQGAAFERSVVFINRALLLDSLAQADLVAAPEAISMGDWFRTMGRHSRRAATAPLDLRSLTRGRSRGRARD